MTNDKCAWLRGIVTFATEMTPDKYKSWNKNFDEIPMEMLRKTIGHEYSEMDLSQKLDKYYQQYQNNEDFILKLAVILYELREKNKPKFDTFVQSYLCPLKKA